MARIERRSAPARRMIPVTVRKPMLVRSPAMRKRKPGMERRMAVKATARKVMRVAATTSPPRPTASVTFLVRF